MFLGKFRSLRHDESGVIIIIAALLFPVLVAFMGLSLDFGMIFHWKRRQQRAVDAACIGAATEIWRGNDIPTAQAAGHDDAAVNGFNEADATRNIDVQINIPYDGSSTKVEAVITELEVPTYFLRVVGFTDLGVQSRAACGLSNYSTGCVWVLDEDDRASLKANGNIEFDSDCEVMVDSDHPRAITVSGGACMNATYMGTVGDYVNNGNANASCMSGQEIAVNLDTALYPDGASGFTTNPLEQYTPTEPVPDPAGTDIVGTNISVGDGDVVQLLPGRYNGSTTTTIDPVTLLPVTTTSEAIRVTGGIAYFAPGLYVLDSGMRFTGGMIRISADGGGTVSSQAGHPGASFYFTENTYDSDSNWKFLTITGAANVKLYAPATGEYAGWLFWENDLAPDNSPGHRIIGTSDSEMVGIIAFPTRDLFWGGTSTVSDWVMIVVDNLTIAGGAFIPTGGINDSAIPNPLETVTLLE